MPEEKPTIIVHIHGGEIHVTRYHRKGGHRFHEYDIRAISLKNLRRIGKILNTFEYRSPEFDDGEVTGYWSTPAPVYPKLEIGQQYARCTEARREAAATEAPAEPEGGQQE